MRTLIVLRGNSGSGKTTVARRLRLARPHRDVAVVGQDVVRREILREHDVPGGANIALIDTIVRHTLDAGYHVILEGILAATRYAPMLEALRRDHDGPSHWYYFDIPFEETLRRHATRPQRDEFGPTEMAAWYRPRDLLPTACEKIIPAGSALPETVHRLLTETSLLAGEPLLTREPLPRRLPGDPERAPDPRPGDPAPA
ncbi:kinase [Actinomadura kijaniata]|uniref:kinase n=1 Tax=Actinomadura kijaniata TaxID=46161 RepID=UPI00082FDADD|nr:kinase [Actinomadura kijaniata]